MLTFKNKELGVDQTLFPNQEPTQRTVANIVVFLKQKFPFCSIPESTQRYNNFATLFRFERPLFWGWSLVSLTIDGTEFSIIFPNGLLLYKVFATFFFYLYRDESSTFAPLSEKQKEDFQTTCVTYFQHELGISKEKTSLLYQTIVDFILFYKDCVPVNKNKNTKILGELASIAKTDLF